MNDLDNLKLLSFNKNKYLPSCNKSKLINCLKQSCSLYFSFFIIYLMNSNVNKYYYIAGWCNTVTAFIFHSNQQPCKEKYYCNILGTKFGPFHSSYNANWNHNTTLFNILYRLDLFFICNVLIYSGLYTLVHRIYLTIFLSCIGCYKFNYTLIMIICCFISIMYRSLQLV